MSAPPVITWHTKELLITAGTSWLSFSGSRGRHLFRLRQEGLLGICQALEQFFADPHHSERITYPAWERNTLCKIGEPDCLDQAALITSENIWLRVGNHCDPEHAVNYHIDEAIGREIMRWFSSTTDAEAIPLADNQTVRLVARIAPDNSLTLLAQDKATRRQLVELPLAGELAAGLRDAINAAIGSQSAAAARHFEPTGPGGDQLLFSVSRYSDSPELALTIASSDTSLMFMVSRVELAQLSLKLGKVAKTEVL